MIESNAVAGAQLVADDLVNAFGLQVLIDAETDDRLGDSIGIRIPELGVEMGYRPSAEVAPESVACQLASHIQDDVLSRTGMIWPEDRGRGDQPLVPGDTGWYRESEPAVVVPYGHAGAAHRPDGSLESVVRWWLGYWFVGAIADPAGDVWFSEHEFDGDLSMIHPGVRVDYEVGERFHGKLRKATVVRVAG
ncbi:hypothetical protein IU449_15045 [Nocardia higoensis]|uniref:Uncharacterized protein n=1 Tax=Nocardia higoensis TaxID=228599 RepID=A0ABS0DDA1_9NOCA|nr:hypothetical protein [Nocardia higoensis]MBF6355848.1 hypothetical protein [Nocardia higoensis]